MLACKAVGIGWHIWRAASKAAAQRELSFDSVFDGTMTWAWSHLSLGTVYAGVPEGHDVSGCVMNVQRRFCWGRRPNTAVGCHVSCKLNPFLLLAILPSSSCSSKLQQYALGVGG